MNHACTSTNRLPCATGDYGAGVSFWYVSDRYGARQDAWPSKVEPNEKNGQLMNPARAFMTEATALITGLFAATSALVAVQCDDTIRTAIWLTIAAVTGLISFVACLETVR